MGKFRYKFVLTNGRVITKLLSPSKAETFGASIKVKVWGLASRLITKK